MAVSVNAAVYGQGVYGVARYDLVVVSNLDQVQATASVSQVGVESSRRIGGVSASISVSTPAAESFSTIPSTSATINVSDIQVSPDKLLDPVSATGDVSGVVVDPSAGLNGVGGNTDSGQLQVEIDTVIDSVFASINVNTVSQFVEVPLPSLQLLPQTGLLVVTGTIFPYDEVANLYSRSRTVLLPRG